ncbi:Sec7 domain protein [Salix suchowensis]|nr:Sec7 domain protein [Salix suchowensis]
MLHHEMILETVNDMDAEAKARAVKKARKLSRVFGDVPSAVLADELSSGNVLPVRPTPQVTPKRRASLAFFQLPPVPELSMQRTHRPATAGSSRPTRPLRHLPECEHIFRRDGLRASLSCSISIASDSTPSKISLELDTYTEELEPPPELTLRQTRRRSSAKLSRHLGEIIPPELVSPTRPEASFHLQVPPRRWNDSMGRKSMDSVLPNRRPSQQTEYPGKSNTNLKRSKSLWTRKNGETNESILSSDAAFHERYNISFGDEDAVRERCRALKVKRVRKITQVFGQDPPPELMRAIADEPERAFTGNGYRDSVASFFSLSRTYLSSTTPSWTPRSRSTSVTSTTSETGFVTAPEDEGRSPTPDRSSSLKRTSTEDMLDARQTPPRRSATISSVYSYTEQAFRERRLRAAKLAHFFGVNYQNISNSIAHKSSQSTVAVNIQVTAPSRFWGWFDGRREATDAEINDVIPRLRDLRAG